MRDLIDLRAWMDETADKIVAEESDPDQWDTLVLYLLEALEARALRRIDGEGEYLQMLEKVRTGIADRLEQQGW